MSNADLVADFHRAIGADVPDRPAVPDLETFELRETLLREEFEEVLAQFAEVRARTSVGGAIGLAELAPLAHELVDLLYVTYGALVAFGVSADRVFREVHGANLAKASGPRRDDGKQMKPKNWRAADVVGVLRSQ